MDFSRREYWSGFLCPSPGICPIQGSNLRLLHCQADSLPPSHQGSPYFTCSSVYTPIPIFQFIPSPSSLPSTSTCLFSIPMSLFQHCKWVHLSHFSRFHIHIYVNIGYLFSLSGLLYDSLYKLPNFIPFIKVYGP